MIGGGQADLTDPFWNQNISDSTLNSSLTPDPMGIEDQVNSGGSSKIAGAFATIDRDPDAEGLGGLGLSLEILKPINVVKLLLGQTADIVFWDIPRFDVGLTLEQSFRPIPILYPFKVTIGFDLGVFADLSVGYDTRGIQTGDFFDGFFFGDRENVSTGPDIAEFGFSVGVRLRAELDLLVASAGIEGELVATILANWRDSDNDGKLYLDEIANIVRQDGVECLFDLTGEFRAIVRLVWSVFGAGDSKDIINALLFSFMNECPKYEVAHVSDGGEALPHGMASLAGDLIVHSGSFAGQRQPGITTDTAEQFTLTQLSPGVIEVDGMGLTQRYGGVQRIVVDGGKGIDIIELINVDLDAVLFGGDGDDVLTSGSGDDIVFGDAGKDIITTNEGEDEIDAGSGDDTIDSGPDTDTIFGGGGIDTIDAGSGIDTVYGGAGDDNIIGGDGGDFLYGEDGDDTIDGGDGMDVIDAGAGMDIITGGPMMDIIEGGLGDDTIEGNDGPDEIYGDGGNDNILGGLGEDTIYGGPGRDYIEGNEEDDEIHGGSGFDTLLGQGGNDDLYGDDGHDLLEGNEGDDFLYGGNDNDLLIGHEGNDELFGGYGNDVILSYIIGDVNDPINVGHHVEGGPNDDFICGTTASDNIWGGTNDIGYALLPAVPPGDPLAGGFSIVSCVDDSEPVFEDPPLVTITGRKFEDKNGDGIFDEDEPLLSGWTIELLDSVGEVAATTTTAADGSYSFDDLDPGTYSVQEVQQDGFLQTYPASLTYDSLVLDGGDVAADIDFGNLTLASVHGLKWSDDDGDGERDEDEAGLADVFIFADSNGNKIWDFGEAFAFSMEDDLETEDEDETGQYWIENLLPGTYEIIEIEPTGYTRTFPVRNVLYENQFEQLNPNNEWSSTEKQGLLNIDRSPQNQRGFLGQESGHENEATTPERLESEIVTLELTNLPDHSTIDLEFDLFVFGGWDGNHASEGQDEWSISADGSLLLATTFSNVAGRDQAYPDSIGGTNPARAGAVEINTLGYDATGLDLNEPGFTAADSVYHLTFSFPHLTDTLNLDFEAVLEDNLGADFEHWGIDNILVSFPIDGHTLTLDSGDTIQDINFGNQADESEIHGTKYHDLNGNGILDPGEPGIGGVTIYSDTNGNGQLDDGEPSTETMGALAGDTNDDGIVGLLDLAVVQQNLGLSRPGLTAADGDLNLDGQVGRGDIVALLANYGAVASMAASMVDSSTSTSSSSTGGSGVGEYWLTDLLPGEHVIREIVPDGFEQTEPITKVVFTDDFTTSLVSSEWSSSSLETSPSGQTYLGQFGNETLSFKLDDLPDHGSVKVQFDLYLVGDWNGATEGADGPSRWILDADGETLIDTTFSNGLGGQNYPDAYPGPVNAEYSGAVAVDSLGYASDSTYRITHIFQRNESDLDFLHLNFTASGIGNSAAGDLNANWGLDNVQITLLDSQRTTSLGAGEIVEGVNLGNTRPGDVTGTKWRDADGNRKRGTNEGGIAGITIYADLNGNGLLENDEPNAVTDTNGNYTIAGLLPGNYIIREIEPSDSVQTVPIQSAYLVTISSGLIVRNIDFANAPRGEIHGVKWIDLNGNSEPDANEPGLGGVTVYADLNNNSRLDAGEPQTVTMADNTSTSLDESGHYWLLGVPSGNITVREVVPTGYQQTFPLNGSHIVDLLPGQTVREIHFGNRPDSGEVHGSKWYDRDGDGQRDQDEPGIGGITIYADLNDNRRLDRDEPRAVTMMDNKSTEIDEAGMYWLTGVPVGKTSIREITPAGFHQTFPLDQYTLFLGAGAVVTGLDFGNQQDTPPTGEVHGTKWEDLNGDGKRTSDEPGLAGVVIYSDLNGNGVHDSGEPSATTMSDDPDTPNVNETGMYWLKDLSAGPYTIREVVPQGFQQTFPIGPYTLFLGAGAVVTGLDFGNQQDTPPTGEVHGTKWEDLNGDGKRTSDEPGLAGVVIYSDLNGNGVHDSGEPSTTTMSDDPDTPNVNETGMYWLKNLSAGPYTIREVVPQGFHQTFPLDQYTLFLGAGAVVTGLDFGNQQDTPPTGEVHGTKWEDLNGDGKRTSDEPGLAGVVIYSDLNGNGVHDSGEPSTTTMSDDPDTPNVNETGMYWLKDLPTGTYVIREVVPTNYVQTFPNAGVHTVTITGGEIIEGLNFGNMREVPAVREIHGTKWFDSNGDGKRTPDEPGVAGVVIYVDSNQNGVRDDGEPFTVTMVDDLATRVNEQGMYWLKGVPAGALQIAEVVPSQFVQSFPINSTGVPYHVVTMPVEGLIINGLNFGNRLGNPRSPDADPQAAPAEEFLAVNDCYGVGSSGVATKLKPGVLANDTLTPPVTAVLVLPPSHGTLAFPGDGSFNYIANSLPFVGVDHFSYLFKDANGTISNTAIVTLTSNQEFCTTHSVHGQKWNDRDGDGIHDPGEPGVAGVTIYADLNGNHTPDPGEPTTTTMSDNLLTEQDETGHYWLDNVPGGTYAIHEVTPDGFVQSFPGDGHTVTVFGDQQLPNLDFGNKPSGDPNDIEIHGFKWEDIDGDGKRGPNEPGLAGVTIYVDLNANGRFDSGEPSTITMEDNPLTGEDETGMYWLAGIPSTADVSTFLVSEVVPAGYVQTFPSENGGSYVVTTQGGTILSGLDFGNMPSDIPTTSVHGFKWEDLDFDRKQGADEPGIGGVVIYADLNNNGKLDADEPSTTTMFDDLNTADVDETGMYWLMPVPVGNDIVIREVVPAGFTQTFPEGDGAHHADLSGTQAPGTFDFGNFQPEYIYDGSDEIYGADGDDTIYGDNDLADPLIISIGDDDWLYGQEGIDTMYGQDENDTLIGGEGADFLYGGVDIDRVVQTVDNHQTLTNGLLTGQGPDTLVDMDIEHATLTGGVSGNIIDASAFTLGGVILIGEGGGDTLTGTDDDDELFGGDGDDTLTAGDGNDILDGGQGSDALGGDAGDDTYLFADTSVIETDSISEAIGGGHDTLDFRALPMLDTLTLNLTTGVANHGTRSITLPGAAFIEDVYGGPGVNNITGNALNNLLVGQDSDDTLDGAAGEDVIISAGGNDTLEGGLDSDLFLFEPNWGTDTVTDAGGSDDKFDFSAIVNDLSVTIGSVTVVQGGNTVTHAANEIEHLLGGDGDDEFAFLDGAMLAGGLGTIDGGPGVNLLDYSAYTTPVTVDLSTNSATGTSNVTNLSNVTGGSAGDAITGDGGVNLLLGLDGADTIQGLDGDDTIYGGSGSDVSLDGGSGSDTIYGEAGNDTMLGGPGDDFFIFETPVGFENDTITETVGPLGGDDTLDFTGLSAFYAINLNLDTGSPASHIFRVMTFTNPAEIEIVLGTPGNDEIVGNAADNHIEGGLGNDILRGMGGSDTLIGGEGDDTYEFDLNTISDENLVIEQVGEGTDTLDFSHMAIGGASDFAVVDLSSDSLAMHNADATRTVTTHAGLAINFENVVGSDGDDVITGSDAENLLQGGDGDDLLLGGLGNDTLEGEGDDDTLFGGRNHDIIRGGSGVNELHGGPNNDTYFFTANATDTIIEDPAEVINGLAVVGGTDTLDFSASAGGINLDLAAANPHLIFNGISLSFENSDGVLTSDNIETVIGSLDFANTLNGNAADNTLIGGNSADVLAGDDGDDLLIGGLGNDQLDGEADDDTIIYDSSDTTQIDGGADNDRLVLEGGTNLDLSTATHVVGFETIDMTASGSQTVQLDDTAVIANGGTAMMIDGTSSDTLVHLDAWNRIVNGATIDTYQHDINLTLTVLVDDDVSVSPPPSPAAAAAAAASPIVAEAADVVLSHSAPLDTSPRAVRRLDGIGARRRLQSSRNSTPVRHPDVATDLSTTLHVLRSHRAKSATSVQAIDQAIADLSEVSRRRRSP